MKTIFIALLACLTTTLVWGEEKTLSVTIKNQHNEAKVDEPVVIKLAEVPCRFEVKGARVYNGGTEVPSQLDDLDRDGVADELAFVVDVPAKKGVTVKVVLSAEELDNDYPARVYAQMKQNDKGGKHPQIQYLTVPGTTKSGEIYSSLYHHGPAFESELVAYRLYFDHRQSIDIYGKRHRQLELKVSDYYSSPKLKEQGYGNDVLWAGKTVSVGSFRGWHANEPQYVDKVALRSEGILAYGPVRTVVEIADAGWQYQGKKLNMVQHYILYAGHRDVEVLVSFREVDVTENTFCTGVMKVEEENVGFLQQDGLAGSWGTNLPEKTDTINNPRETVGLGVCVPKQYVAQAVEDDLNYLLIMNTNGTQSLSYHLTFCAVKEEEGFASHEAWFAYLRRWQKALQSPCEVTITQLSR